MAGKSREKTVYTFTYANTKYIEPPENAQGREKKAWCKTIVTYNIK